MKLGAVQDQACVGRPIEVAGFKSIPHRWRFSESGAASDPVRFWLWPAKKIYTAAPGKESYNAGRKPMPARYVIDRQDRTVRTVFSGVLTRSEVVEHAKKLRGDPDFDPAFSELVDLTEASEVKLGIEDFRMLALVDPFHPKSKRAFVVLSAAIFGVTRMFQLLRDSSANIAIFKTMEEGVAWLREPE